MATYSEDNSLISRSTDDNTFQTFKEMSDSSIARSMSEDDIIEDYDVVLFKAQCLRNRTSLEKILLCFSVIAMVVVLGLAIALATSDYKDVTPDGACRSEQCVRVSSSILSTMDPSADPCNDFYQYACGGWLRETPMPNGYISWDRFQEVSNKNYYILKTQLETKSLHGEAEKKARHFYNSCLDNNRDSRFDTIQKLVNLTKLVNGWPFLTSDDDPKLDSWIFEDALEQIHGQGAWPLFQLLVDVDERGANSYILKIDVGSLGMRSEYFPRVQVKKNITATNDTEVEEKHPFRNYTKLKIKYLEDTKRILTVLGIGDDDARQISNELYDFEAYMSELMTHNDTEHSKASKNNVAHIKSLQRRYPKISWMKYLRNVADGSGPGLTNSDQVVVYHLDYMARVNEVLSGLESNTTYRRIVRNHMSLTLIRALEPFFDDSLFLESSSIEDLPQGHWRRCIFYTNKAMGLATGAIYVNDTSHEASVDKIENLISYIKRAFREHLVNKFWVDVKTREGAAKKIEAIIEKISYPSYILNITFLDEFYKNMDVSGKTWFDNVVKWQEFELKQMFSKIGQGVDRKAWIRPPITTNALYSEKRNDLLFPIAMFHLPFYVPDGPKSFNFGAMGSVIGHEITHAFDMKGRFYDQVGRYKYWWDDHTAQAFDIASNCMRNQYSEFDLNQFKVDGHQTLEENIADNAGVRAANLGYRLWLRDHPDEAQLPGLAGLNITHTQLFYISFAQMYCSKYSDLGAQEHLLHDRHSPGSARVNGVVSNSKNFNYEFNCGYTAKHNPDIKCIVW